MSKIILIRHGQASYGADNYDKLSDKGIEQSKALGKYFAEQNITLDKVYVGKLVRHQETHDAFTETYTKSNLLLPKAVFLEEFNEHHGNETLRLAFDEFTNKYDKAKKLAEEIKENPKHQRRNSLLIFEMFFKEYASGRFEYKHEAVQPWNEFRDQSKKGIDIVKNEIGSGETVAIFTSGGTKSSIIGDVVGVTEEKIADFNLVIKNASFSQLLFSRNNLNLLSMNETPHLSDNLITFI